MRRAEEEDEEGVKLQRIKTINIFIPLSSTYFFFAPSILKSSALINKIIKEHMDVINKK